MNAVECSALQLLQLYHHEGSKQKPIAPPKRKRGTPQRREPHTDLCFASMHHDAAGREGRRQPGPNQEGASLQAPRRSTRLRLNAEQTHRRCSGRDTDRSVKAPALKQSTCNTDRECPSTQARTREKSSSESTSPAHKRPEGKIRTKTCKGRRR